MVIFFMVLSFFYKSIRNSSDPWGISQRKPGPRHWLQEIYSSSLASVNCLECEKTKYVASTSTHCWVKKTVAWCLNSTHPLSIFSFWVSDQWKQDCDMRKSISNTRSCTWAVTDFIIAGCHAACAVSVIFKSTVFKASRDYHRKNRIWFCNPHLK